MLKFSAFLTVFLFINASAMGVIVPRSCGPKLTPQQIASYFEVRESTSESEDVLDSEEYSYFNVEAQTPAPIPMLKDSEQCTTFQGNCEPGWRSWSRPTGEWCMKIFYEDAINQSTAEAHCEEHNAKLSGFQNRLESLWVSYSVSTKIYPSPGSVWFGFKRVESCYGVGMNNKCTAFNSFQWTDGVTTGTDGMLWSCSQPNNLYRKQNCVVLLAGREAYPNKGYQNGAFDDISCNFDDRYVRKTLKAFVCGKPSK